MDEHGFTPDSHGEYGEGWSTAEEERTFRSVRDLLLEMRARGSGIYMRPVREDEPYGVDGWVVGEYGADGPTLVRQRLLDNLTRVAVQHRYRLLARM